MCKKNTDEENGGKVTREKFHGREDDQSCPPRIGRPKEINEPNINHREARHLHPWRVEARNAINRRAALPLSGRRLCISHPVTFLRFLLRFGTPEPPRFSPVTLGTDTFVELRRRVLLSSRKDVRNIRFEYKFRQKCELREFATNFNFHRFADVFRF